MPTTFDLSSLSLNVGRHNIRVKSKAEGYFDSSFSNSVAYYVYSISVNVENGTAIAPVSMHQSTSASILIQPSLGYYYPEYISDFAITNADISAYDNETGELTISNPIGNVSISVTCPIDARQYVKLRSEKAFEFPSIADFAKYYQISASSIMNVSTNEGFDAAEAINMNAEACINISTTEKASSSEALELNANTILFKFISESIFYRYAPMAASDTDLRFSSGDLKISVSNACEPVYSRGNLSLRQVASLSPQEPVLAYKRELRFSSFSEINLQTRFITPKIRELQFSTDPLNSQLASPTAVTVLSNSFIGFIRGGNAVISLAIGFNTLLGSMHIDTLPIASAVGNAIDLYELSTDAIVTNAYADPANGASVNSIAAFSFIKDLAKLIQNESTVLNSITDFSLDSLTSVVPNSSTVFISDDGTIYLDISAILTGNNSVSMSKICEFLFSSEALLSDESLVPWYIETGNDIYILQAYSASDLANNVLYIE